VLAEEDDVALAIAPFRQTLGEKGESACCQPSLSAIASIGAAERGNATHREC
jgi:hypothetical protein